MALLQAGILCVKKEKAGRLLLFAWGRGCLRPKNLPGSRFSRGLLRFFPHGNADLCHKFSGVPGKAEIDQRDLPGKIRKFQMPGLDVV